MMNETTNQVPKELVTTLLEPVQALYEGVFALLTTLSDSLVMLLVETLQALPPVSNLPVI